MATDQIWRTYTGAEYATVRDISCWVIANGLLIDANGETSIHEDDPDIAAEIERRGVDVYRDHGYGEGHEGVHVAGCDHSDAAILAELEQARADRIALAAFAMDHHDLENACGCHGTPGADCSQWCKACKVLAGLPSDVLEAATAKRTADEIERSR